MDLLFKQRVFLSQHLDQMLSLHGRKILPPAFFTGGTLSADDLRAAIVRHASPGEVLNNPNLPTTYELAAGKLEVYRTHVVFYPTAGGTALRAQATDLPPQRDAFAVAQPEPPTTNPTGPTYLSGLNAQQVQSVIQQINKAAGQPMNPAQTSTMQTLLQSNKPQLVPPGYAYAAVRLARVNPDGGIQVWVTRVMIEMDVNGVAGQMITTSAHKITLNPFAVTLLASTH